MARRLLGTAWGWAGFALACLVVAVFVVPPILVLRLWRPDAQEHFERLTSGLLRGYARSLPFLRLEVEREAEPLHGSRIVVANHQSWLDPILMIGIEPRIRGPARSYLFRAPALATILRTLGFFPADGGSGEPLARLQRDAASARSDAGALLFFPEGTRSRDGEVAPFQRGAFRIAFDHGLPIQPVVIEGLDRVLPPGVILVRNRDRAPVRVRYLTPVLPPFGEGVRRDVVRALAERVRATIAEELDRMRAERGDAGHCAVRATQPDGAIGEGAWARERERGILDS